MLALADEEIPIASSHVLRDAALDRLGLYSEGRHRGGLSHGWHQARAAVVHSLLPRNTPGDSLHPYVSS